MPSATLAAWEQALRGTGASTHSRLGDALDHLTTTESSLLVWAVDLSTGTGGSVPKLYVVATPSVIQPRTSGARAARDWRGPSAALAFLRARAFSRHQPCKLPIHSGAGHGHMPKGQTPGHAGRFLGSSRGASPTSSSASFNIWRSSGARPPYIHCPTAVPPLVHLTVRFEC